MDKEQKAMFSDMGKQAAYLYNGAGGVSVRYNADGTIMHD